MGRTRDGSRARPRHEGGETLVEFAIASTVFFMIIFGAMEFSQAVFRYNLVSDLAQEGVRWASVRGHDSLTPASSSDVQNFVTARALGLNVTVTTTPTPSSLYFGDTVTVQVTHSFTPLTPLIPYATLMMQNTAKMIVAK